MKKPVVNRILTSFVLIVLASSLFLPLLSSEAGEEVQGLVVPEGETLIIEDKTLFVEGNIDVKGTLILNNVDLILNTTSTNTYEVQDGGVLTVKNSHIISFEDYVKRSLSLELEPGYHLLSFPFVRDDNTVETVLSPIEGSYDKVLYYDTWDESWKSYQIDRPPHFNTLEYINRTMGVVVNITQDAVLELEGTLPYHTEILLNQGLNMVAYPLDEPMELSEAFDGIMEDIKKVEEESPHGQTQLEPGDQLIPGRGYRVEMYNRTSWTLEVPYGLPYDYALNLSRGAGIGFEFMPGSSISIEDSKITGSGNPQADPELIVHSNQVMLTRTEFVGGSSNIFVEASSPTIRDSTFEEYLDTAVYTRYSSLTLRNNQFRSHEGLAVSVYRGSPVFTDNLFEGHIGIQLDNAESTLLKNTFNQISEVGVIVNAGESTLEDNIFSHIDGPAIESYDSIMKVRENRFTSVSTGLKLEGGEVFLEKNSFEGVGNGIVLSGSRGEILGNDIMGSLSWGLRLTQVENVTVKNNKIHNGSNAMRLSGRYIDARYNTVSNITGTGVLAVSAESMLFKRNIVESNGGVGLNIDESTGAVLENTISKNEGGGLWTGSPIWIANNTISRNDVFGISVVSSSPYIENNTLYTNLVHGISFEKSSSMISSTSILGGIYHLRLIRSNITVVDSYVDETRIWQDRYSRVQFLSRLNLTIPEDTEFTNYNLTAFLPPGSKILSVENNDPIEVNIHEEGVDFKPPDNFHGTVNMSFEVQITETITTWFSFALVVTPVNDPPVLEEVDVIISDSPSKVRWLVRYTDVDGYPPTYLEIVIDGDSYTMEPVHPEDDDYAIGVLYQFEKHLSPGEYSYYYIAEENNPLGSNITVRTDGQTLEVPSDIPRVLESVGEGALLAAVIILFILIIYKVVAYRRDTEDDRFGLHGENWLDDISGEEIIGGSKPRAVKDETFKSLPVMNKKTEGSKSLPVMNKKTEGSKGLPVMNKDSRRSNEKPVLMKKKDKKRKLRVLTDDNGEVESSQDESIIDSVGEPSSDEVTEEQPVEISRGNLKRHRKIKQEKDRWLVKKKHRALKEESSGKKKRVLKS